MENEVAVREEGQVQEQGITLFGTKNPEAILKRAQAIATPLSGVIEKQKLYTEIGNKKFVRVEGWTLLGSMTGVFPVLEWSRQLPDGWEARVMAQTISGNIIGAAEAECTRSEKNWSTRDDYALRSMAQTRATSKALRIPLGFIMALSGYETTPAEEVTKEMLDNKTSGKPPTQPPKAKAQEPDDIPADYGHHKEQTDTGENPPQAAVEMITDKQDKWLYAYMKRSNIDWGIIVQENEELTGLKVKDLTKEQARSLIDKLIKKG